MERVKLSPEAVIPHAECNTLFDHFPTDGALYYHDVAEVAPRILARYGVGEWRSVVVAMELHGHVGLYALLGVKMGCRALELLEAARGDVSVRSYAGFRPPISCLNDGLQASTGATLGHGSIAVLSPQVAHVEALFTAGTRSVRLILKREIVQLIEDELHDMVRHTGDNTPEYWAAIRQLAIEKWLRFDRRAIFDVSERIG